MCTENISLSLPYLLLRISFPDAFRAFPLSTLISPYRQGGQEKRRLKQIGQRLTAFCAVTIQFIVIRNSCSRTRIRRYFQMCPKFWRALMFRSCFHSPDAIISTATSSTFFVNLWDFSREVQMYQWRSPLISFYSVLSDFFICILSEYCLIFLVNRNINYPSHFFFFFFFYKHVLGKELYFSQYGFAFPRRHVQSSFFLSSSSKFPLNPT